jgi:hypothetical protein
MRRIWWLGVAAAIVSFGCGGSKRHFDAYTKTPDFGEAGQAGVGGASGEAGEPSEPSDAGASGEAGSGAATSAGADTGGTTTGGASGTGGTPTAGQGGALTAGGGSGGGAGTPPVVDTTLAGTWDGALVQYACGASSSAYDCQQPTAASCQVAAGTGAVPTPISPSNGAPTKWTMGGDPNVAYAVTFRIRGIVEVKYYPGGSRPANASVLTVPRNLFQEGGAVPPPTSTATAYSTYELDVTPPVQGLPNQAAGRVADVYYLNSVVSAESPATFSATIHATFDVDYSATIKVMGGGKISFNVSDPNCIQIQNCGTDTQNCTTHRTVDLSGASPAAPAFAQPLTTGGAFGQWVFFDVTGVAVSP